MNCPHGHDNGRHSDSCAECETSAAYEHDPGRHGASGTPSRASTADEIGHQAQANNGLATEAVLTSARPVNNWVVWATSLFIVVVSIVLALTAFHTMRVIRAATPAPSPVTNTGNPLTAVSATPQPSPPTPTVVVIGGPCSPQGANGRTADGSVAYCEELRQAELLLWSLYPGDILLSGGDSMVAQYGSSVAVCIEQTGRTPEDCRNYLQANGAGTPVP